MSRDLYGLAFYRNGSLEISEDGFGPARNAEIIQVGNEVANFYEVGDNPKLVQQVIASNSAVASSLGQQVPSVNPIVQGKLINICLQVWLIDETNR